MSRAAFLPVLLLGIAGGARTESYPSNLNGRWDLTVQDPGGDYPGWIEVKIANGKAHVLFVGRIGHARELNDVSLTQGVLRFSVPPDGLADATEVYQARLDASERGAGRYLEGTMLEAGHPERRWTGVPAPALRHAAPTRWSAAEPIFDGHSLRGWHLSRAAGSNWSVRNGMLVTEGRGADLISDRAYRDLRLHMEWRCSEGANSGVYLRGRYEVQIETDSAREPPSHHTGGVYGFLSPEPEQSRRPGVWHSFDITLVGRTVTVVEDGVMVIAGREIAGITGGALNSREAEPGPIVLQGGETGRIEFRNLRVRESSTRARAKNIKQKEQAAGVDRRRLAELCVD